MIISHPTLRFDSDDRYGGSSPCMVVQCDFCPKMATAANTIHDAVGEAQRKGYATVRGETPVSPRKWACPGCRSKQSATK